ncbi:hypothetical protein NRIC_34810 [Enterococcus florum]|uniref:Peptidase C39-like domain-containing protein n=1 Tax=Enterococcus florum TaxID=2480627 RepID=A0A4P5PC02_9ENTE|nr:hypothetical protein [Enterococcus florum]GCF95590.1 hypothetical protein NRIC_34810 [Enterococcus florum]
MDGCFLRSYKDFAEANDDRYKGLGTNIQATVVSYVEKNIPILVAARPGIFTTIGHTLVLIHVSDYGFWLLDPSNVEESFTDRLFRGAIIS